MATIRPDSHAQTGFYNMTCSLETWWLYKKRNGSPHCACVQEACHVHNYGYMLRQRVSIITVMLHESIASNIAQGHSTAGNDSGLLPSKFLNALNRLPAKERCKPPCC